MIFNMRKILLFFTKDFIILHVCHHTVCMQTARGNKH